MLKQLQNLFEAWMRGLAKSKNDRDHGSCSIVTSCKFPIMERRRFIWLVEFRDDAEYGSYQWFETETELNEACIYLSSLGFYIKVSKYEIEL